MVFRSLFGLRYLLIGVIISVNGIRGAGAYTMTATKHRSGMPGSVLQTELNGYGFCLWGSPLRKGACFTGIQKLLSVKAAEDLDQLSDHAGPSGLVAGSQTRSVIAVEVLEEQDVVLPLGIGLELLRTAIHRPPARFIPQEDSGQTIGDLAGYLEQVHQLARAGGALDFEVVSVIQVVTTARRE